MKYFWFSILYLWLSLASAQNVSLESVRLADTLVSSRNYSQLFPMLEDMVKKQGVSEIAAKVLTEEIKNVAVKNMAVNFTKVMTLGEIKEATTFFQSAAGQKYLTNALGYLSGPDNQSLVRQACEAAMQRLAEGPDRSSLSKYSECKS